MSEFKLSYTASDINRKLGKIEQGFSASEIDYDGSESGISADNLQEAIDELKELTKTAPADTDYTTYRLRNVAILSAMPTSMSNGDIAFICS